MADNSLICDASHLWHGRFAVHGELEGHLVGAVVVGGLAGEETLVLPGHRVQLQLGLVLLAVVHQHAVLGVVHQLGPAHKPSEKLAKLLQLARVRKPFSLADLMSSAAGSLGTSAKMVAVSPSLYTSSLPPRIFTLGFRAWNIE